jgi:hypothetical protein
VYGGQLASCHTAGTGGGTLGIAIFSAGSLPLSAADERTWKYASPFVALGAREPLAGSGSLAC